MLKLVGYNTSKVNFIPVSGWKGDNLVKKSENMPWYKGSTLAEALDTFEPPEKPIGKPLRIPIQDVYSITGVGHSASWQGGNRQNQDKRQGHSNACWS